MQRLLAVVALAATMVSPILPAGAQGQRQRIGMKDVSFAPAQVTARVGDTLEWANSDIVAHTASSKEGGFDVNVLPGRTGSTVVKAPGTFNYICRYHPNMKGQIVVEP